MITLIILAVAAFVLGFGACFAWRFRPWHSYDVVIHGWHSHRCDCGYEWEHNDEVMPLGKITEQHTCEGCGVVVLQVHEHRHYEDAPAQC